MTPLLYLRRFSTPLTDAWQAEQMARLTSTERARLARISRPQRRAQFVVAHCNLRCALASAGLDDAVIEVDAEGRTQLHAGEPVYASIAHSEDYVAVIVAGDPVGVDLESIRADARPGRGRRNAGPFVGRCRCTGRGLAGMGDGRSSTKGRPKRKSAGLAV